MWGIEVYNQRGDPLGSLELEPLEIAQYEHYPLAFHFVTDESIERFQLYIEGEPLTRNGSVFLFGSNEANRGRIGEVEIIIYDAGNPIAHRYLTYTTAHFSEAQYRFMIQDIKRLLSIASKDPANIRSREESWEQIMLSFYEEQLNDIEQYIPTLVKQVERIAHAPRTSIQKRYFLTQETKAVRIDGRTIQWASRQGESRPGYAITYSHIESYDLFEHRVIAHIIDWLQSMLVTIPERYRSELHTERQRLQYRLQELQKVLNLKDSDSDNDERKKFREQQKTIIENHIEVIKKIEIIELPPFKRRVEICQRTLVMLRSQSLLATIPPQIALVVKPTLILLRDPAYRLLYDGYRDIRQKLQSEKLQEIGQILDRMPIERTSKLYEYWVFLQVYYELIRMGFIAKAGATIWSLIDKRSFRLRSNACVEMIGDDKLYTSDGRPLELRLFYEIRLGAQGKRCPDIYIEFKRGKTAVLILDAKYRDYHDPESPDYRTDIEDVAYHKYLKLEQKLGKNWIAIPELDSYREVIKASFIVHSTEDNNQSQFLDYGSEGKENQYGSIPLVPDEHGVTITHLRLLLAMFMRVHLGIHHICWSTQHSVPQHADRIKELGGDYRKDWEWQYRCQSCQNAWWINHCGHCRKEADKNIMKITFSDPADNFYAPDEKMMANGRQLMKCAKCNKSYSNPIKL